MFRYAFYALNVASLRMITTHKRGPYDVEKSLHHTSDINTNHNLCRNGKLTKLKPEVKLKQLD